MTASFNSVSGLRPGAEVEIAGVRVGRVKSIRLDDKQPRAVVELQLGDNVHLTDDVIASVKTSGLIGDKYISLEPGRFWGTVEERRRNYGHRIGGGY